MYCRAAESSRLIRVFAAQNENADARAQESENRTGTARFGDDVNRRETGDARNENADDNLDDIRRVEFRMDLIQAHGHQAVAAHGIEGPALGIEHAQYDCRQAAECAGADDSRA